MSIILPAAGATIAIIVIAYAAYRLLLKPDAYVYVPEGVFLAEWQYKQLPMKTCAFCGSGVNLNRHHAVPQLAAPERKNDPKNLIVLCRSCHQVVGHKNNWKKFNPYVVEICDKYGGPPVDSREWREANSCPTTNSQETTP